MRIGIVIFGVILLIIGAVLMFVPIAPQANQTVQSGSSAPFYEAQVSGFSLTGSIPVAVSWTSTSNVEVIAAASSCSGSSCGNATSISGATVQSGTSGSFTLNQPDGGTIVMGALSPSGTPANVTFKITTAESTIGSILVIVGILLLIVGVVLRKKTPMAPAPMAAAPSGNMGAPPAQ